MKTKTIKTQAEVEAAIKEGGHVGGYPSIIELTTKDGNPRSVRIGNFIVRGDYGVSIEQVVEREEVERYKVSYRDEVLGDFEEYFESEYSASEKARSLNSRLSDIDIKVEKVKVEIDEDGEIMRDVVVLVDRTGDVFPF